MCLYTRFEIMSDNETDDDTWEIKYKETAKTKLPKTAGMTGELPYRLHQK